MPRAVVLNLRSESGSFVAGNANGFSNNVNSYSMPGLPKKDAPLNTASPPMFSNRVEVNYPISP
jgi:hypothetical protein